MNFLWELFTVLILVIPIVVLVIGLFQFAMNVDDKYNIIIWIVEKLKPDKDGVIEHER